MCIVQLFFTIAPFATLSLSLSLSLSLRSLLSISLFLSLCCLSSYYNCSSFNIHFSLPPHLSFSPLQAYTLIAFIVIYIIEVVLGIIAYTCLIHPQAYLRRGWSLLDLAVILFG